MRLLNPTVKGILLPSLFVSALALQLSSCQSSSAADTVKTPAAEESKKEIVVKDSVVKFSAPADAAAILNRKQVPILCYHHVKDWRPGISRAGKDYIVPVATFKEQIKMLADSGYHTVLPDQLMDYLNFGKELPSKPVMLTFDDTDLEQYTIAAEEMKKYNFKGVFFIMTVSLNRPNYMTKDMVKELAVNGHEIGSHTWDHRNVKLYQEKDWVEQIEKPTKQLMAITGKPVKYFAYPFGLWNPEAIPNLKNRGFTAAFQLSTKRDPIDPLYTIRRIIVPGDWGGKTLSNAMRNSFK